MGFGTILTCRGCDLARACGGRFLTCRGRGRGRAGTDGWGSLLYLHYISLLYILTVSTQYITIHYMAATCRGLGRGRVGTGGGGGVGVAAGKRVGELPTACAFAFVCVAMQF